MDKAGFSERLNAALDLYGAPAKGEGRQTFVSELFGITQSSARKWLEGEGYPRTSRLNEIVVKLRVSRDWLLLGIDQNMEVREEKAEYLVKLTPAERDYWLENIAKLDKKNRIALKTILNAMLAVGDENSG